jgi:F-type H+-transporting ATPase subunit epsilon
MPPYEHSFQCKVLTAEGERLAADAVSATFPAGDGMVGVLARCGPLAATIGAGPLAVRKHDGETARFFVAGGFVHVRNDVMTVLADECLPADQVKADPSRRQLEEARRMPARSAEAQAARDRAVRAARARLREATKHRH